MACRINRPVDIHFTVVGHLCCLQFGAITNNGAMNIFLVSYGDYVYIFLSYRPESTIARLNVLIGSANSLTKWLCKFILASTVYENSH